MVEGSIIDLSQEIYAGMPVYTGHMKTVIRTRLLGRRVTFIAVPLKIRAGIGSPVRTVVILGEA